MKLEADTTKVESGRGYLLTLTSSENNFSLMSGNGPAATLHVHSLTYDDLLTIQQACTNALSAILKASVEELQKWQQEHQQEGA